MKIKAVNITNLTDARYFAAQGVTYMHFDFRETSPAYISPIQAIAIIDWIEGINFIGQWETDDVALLNRFLTNTSIKAVQIEENFPVDDIASIAVETVFRKIFIDERTTLHTLQQRIEKYEGEKKVVQEIFATHDTFENLLLYNKKIIFEDFISLTEHFLISLDISFNANDLQQLIPLNLYALCLHGGAEEQVGIKSYDVLDKIFEKIG